MATMTATIIKSNDSRAGPKTNLVSLENYHHSNQAAMHPSYSNLSYPYVPYPNGKKDPSAAAGHALFADSAHKSSSLNATEAFILKQNLILRSSSLYDNRKSVSREPGEVNNHNKPYNGSLSDCSYDLMFKNVNATPHMISNGLLPRVELAKAQKSDINGSKSIEQGNRENVDYKRRALDKLSVEQTEQLSRLIYKHFAMNRKNSIELLQTGADPVPEDYNEEDPQTWPSNWLSQAPTMILKPDVYLAQKPTLNTYQRQLIRRIASKYEPLVQHYLYQLSLASASSRDNGSSSGGDSGRKPSRLPTAIPAEDLNNEHTGNSSMLMRLGKSRQQQHPPPPQSMVKSASLSSSLSSQARIVDSPPINSANNSSIASVDNNNVELLMSANSSFCHKEAGTLISSAGIKPELVAANAIASRGVKPVMDDSIITTTSRTMPKGSDLLLHRQSSSPAEVSSVSSSRSSPKLPSDQSRLSRLSAMQLNKWSNKMKIYLRKN